MKITGEPREIADAMAYLGQMTGHDFGAVAPWLAGLSEFSFAWKGTLPKTQKEIEIDAEFKPSP